MAIKGNFWDDGDYGEATKFLEAGYWWWEFSGIGGLSGTDAADEIYGYGGNDVLDGGEGTDLMNGGAGNDSYYVDNSNDYVADAHLYYHAGTSWDFEAGYDTVCASVNFNLADRGRGVERLYLVEGSAATDGLGNELNNQIHGNSNENFLRGRDGDDWLYGNGDNDTLWGDAGNDRLYGGSHGDTLEGGADNDTLDGGTGGDTMRGGTGNDRYYVDNAADVVIENFNEGWDTVLSSRYSFTLGYNFEELRLLDGAVYGTGNARDNQIYGNDSSNTLDGGFGDDDLSGNGGDDVYWVDSAGDRVFESANDGIDRVYVTDVLDYRLSANVEELQLEAGAVNGTGNGLANNIFGNAGANRIDGGFGNDYLTGGDGIDTISFESWDFGTQGNSESISINVAGTAVRMQSIPGVGTSQLERDTFAGFENVRSSNRHETIIGDSGANILEARGGDDVLRGGRGNDTLDGGDGVDTADYVTSLSSQGRVVLQLGANGADGLAMQVLTASTGQIVGLEFDTLRNIENVRGTSWNDELRGNELDNVLDGLADADVMVGGAGNDTYIVDNALDVASEGSGQGALDRVKTMVSYTLDSASEIEVLETNQAGALPINLTGNGFNNTINGNNGANRIEGRGGSDTLTGFGGADTFVFAEGENEHDVITDFTLGVDRINLSATEVQNFNDLFTDGDRFMEQVGNDVLIHTSVSDDTDIVLQNVQLSSLTAADFIF
jgi:trimeric autotransporter adhesin